MTLAERFKPSSSAISPKKSEGLRIDNITSFPESSLLLRQTLTLPEIITNNAEPSSSSVRMTEFFGYVLTVPSFETLSKVSEFSSEKIGTEVKNSMFSTILYPILRKASKNMPVNTQSQ
jgi:hypothetical protein